jgi:hypothetical protein
MASARLDIVDHVCDAGAQHSDDLWGSAGNAAWIMDGATGLSGERIFPDAASDAAWFVAAIDRGLRAADWQKPARDCLGKAVDTTEHRFRQEAVSPPSDMSSWPSGAVTILAVREHGVELVNLGDCKLLFRGAGGGPARSFGTSALGRLDRMLVDGIIHLQKEGVTEPAAMWQRVLPHIRANRARMNTEGGYWVLDVPGRGLDHADELVVAADQIREFLLVTDGFYRLVDTYGIFDDETLLDAALARGLAALCRELRAIEAQDPGCHTYPRLKPRDDATAVLGRIMG